MEKPEKNDVRNMEDENNDNNQQENNRSEHSARAALDELIQEDAKLKECIETAQQSKRKWRIRNSAIENSNWKLELDVKNLRDFTQQLQNEVVAKSEESQKSYDELEIYKTRNKQEAADFWANFQEEQQKYSNLFVNGHIEYSSDCLKQDIEEYRRQSKIVRGLIENIEKEMKALKARYGLAELGTNVQSNLLTDINTAKDIISDKKLLLRATKSAEDNIELLKLKVKQKKDEIAYLRNQLDEK